MNRAFRRSSLYAISCLTIACAGGIAANPLANWSADYPPCRNHHELLKRSSMNLGVRLGTTNAVLAEQFKLAMNFWQRVLDLDWHIDNTDNCAIQLVDGERSLFNAAPDTIVARAQFPDRSGFEGWIVFNPAVTLSRVELYRISVHEIGHMLGLPHNTNTASLMYGLDLEDSEDLDSSDLALLASRHKMRIDSVQEPVKLTKVR